DDSAAQSDDDDDDGPSVSGDRRNSFAGGQQVRNGCDLSSPDAPSPWLALLLLPTVLLRRRRA
ncbi:MAG: hypothetical protein KDA24_13130, partial [Deltaproteobacteria bacterium]|nr:hypothetical protein [Deltaproteobacteria bacterium]